MPRRHLFRTAGWALIILALLGLLVIADDWRHTGELAGVGAVLASGLAFLGASSTSLSQRLALEWLPAGIAVGLVVGFATDHTALGTVCGLAGGVVLACARHAARRES